MDTRKRQLRSLRLALLASLGLPASCGGEVENNRSDDTGDSAAVDGTGGTSSTKPGATAVSSGPMVTNASSSVVTGGFVASTGTSGVTPSTGTTATGAGGFPTSTTATTGLPPASACTLLEERWVAGVPSGFFECEEGFEVRQNKLNCPNLLPDKGMGGVGGAAPEECMVDTDCPGALEYCEIQLDTGLGFCRQGCLSDDGCPDGMLCRCDEPIGKCAVATCETNADCPGSWCASLTEEICSTTYQFTCLTAADQCHTSADCDGAMCLLAPGNVRACGFVDCGRPFLVDAEQRTAVVVGRSDWRTEFEIATDLLPAERRALARHWQQVGLMEHASVAAFARFALQLLSIGAPAALVAGAQHAMADETRHAKQAFGIASSYGNESVGPGPLATSDALSDTTLETLVTTTVLEGCIGETVAAMEARAASACCADPAIRRVLTGIADDEARHAQLAWQFLAYCLEHYPKLRGVALSCFEASSARAFPANDELPGLDLTRHGVLSARERRHLINEVLNEVVMPCARQLLRNARHASRAEQEPSKLA